MVFGELGLSVATPASWAAAVLCEPLALLADHAHLERKAALGALGLLDQWPQKLLPTAAGSAPDAAARWARVLAGVARDESEHLALVLRLLVARGGRLPRGHSNPYAAALFAAVRTGQSTDQLVDRLCVAALIEARSCERFELLAEAASDPDLRALYHGLCASERGHHRAFLDLAALLAPEPTLAVRWGEWLAIEAVTLARQAPGPRMHSGWAPATV